MVTHDPELTVTFLGADPADIWGGTLGNFMIDAPYRNAKEVAVLLNEPTSKHLAEVTGQEDNAAFRVRVLESFGQVWLRMLLEQGRSPESTYILSKMLFDQNPEYFDIALEALRASVS